MSSPECDGDCMFAVHNLKLPIWSKLNSRTPDRTNQQPMSQIDLHQFPEPTLKNFPGQWFALYTNLPSWPLFKRLDETNAMEGILG
mmetsp:Transcript_862/g.1685  ORF Transcript_862/g.1685 Transcript_862/m.1685 type:complete len:86 (-) Transcript_862:328-585(-)